MVEVMEVMEVVEMVKSVEWLIPNETSIVKTIEPVKPVSSVEVWMAKTRWPRE
jgi:hypothetical protein